MEQLAPSASSASPSSSSSSSQPTPPNIVATGNINGNYLVNSSLSIVVQASAGPLLGSEKKQEVSASPPLLIPASSAQYTSRELLQSNYKARAKLTSFLFKDYEQPLHDVSFTIAHYDVAKEKARLEAKRQREEEKEEEKVIISQQKNSQEEDPWVAEWRTEEIAPQEMILVKDIFTPTARLQNQKKRDDPERKSSSEPKASIPETPVRRVLILGPPGSGKTTLSKHLMSEWLEKRALSQYKNAFWITARDLNDKEKYALFKQCANSGYPLAALIHQLCLDEDAQQKIGIKAVDRVLKNKRTLVLLDGFDEVSHWLSEDTDYGKPLKKLLNAILQAQSDLIVTSRDYSIPPDNIPFDRRLINRGFTDAQIESYVKRYFSRLPKTKDALELKSGEENIGNLVQRLKKNAQLWSHVHNPLILTLVCDYHRLQQEGGKVQKDLNLLDLYDETLKVFLRRYLDLHTQSKKSINLCWEKTQEFSLKGLIEQCPIEIDFLKTLSFKGIEEGHQLFDKILKEAAFEEVRTRYAKKISEIPIRNALKLGLLHEFSGPEAASLHKTHEFLHLTFQEYLAARYIAERLQRHDPKMYQWLRDNKYNPSYRMVLNFLCAQMPANTYPKFWEVLLKEKSSIVDRGHLYFMMQRLEAANWGASASELRKYLIVVEQSWINVLKTKRSWKVGSMLKVFQQSPQLTKHCSEQGWRTIRTLLQSENPELRKGSARVLSGIAFHASRISVKRRAELLVDLLKAAADKKKYVRHVAAEGLTAYAAQAGQFSEKERTQLLDVLWKAIGDKVWDVRSAAAGGLFAYAKQASQFSEKERSQLLEALQKAAADKNEYMQSAAAKGLIAYAAQAGQFFEKERTQLLDVLWKAVGDKERHVRYAAAEGLVAYAKQASQFSEKERSQLLEALQKAAADKNEYMQSAAAKGLIAYAAQAGQFSKKEQSQLLDPLWKAVGNEDENVRHAAAKSLAARVEQAGQFSEKERNQLLDALRKAAADDKEWYVRFAAAEGLASYAKHVGQFSEKERTQFLDALWKAAGDEDVDVRYAGAEGLSAYTAHAGRFSEKERSQLLEALQKAACNENAGVRYAAVEGLSAYAAHAGRFSEKERAQFFGVLWKAIGDKDKFVRYAAARGLAAYAAQAGQFSEKERSQLFDALGKATRDKEEYLRYVAAQAFAACAKQAEQFSEKERTQLFDALGKAARDPEKNVRYAAYLGLPSCLSHSEDWRKMDYSENYLLLNQMLQDQYFLPTRSLDELLDAYFKDAGSSALNSYPCCGLWLQLLIVHIMHQDAISIVIYRDHCRLYSVKTVKRSTVAIPTQNRAQSIQKLKQAISSSEAFLGLVWYTVDVQTPLPKAIPAKISREYRVLEEIPQDGQDKVETKAEFNGEKESLVFHLEVYEPYMQAIEKNILQLQAQLQDHQNLQKNHQTLKSTFQEIQKSIEQLQQQDAYTPEALEKLKPFKAREEAIIKAYEKIQKQLTESENLLDYPESEKPSDTEDFFPYAQIPSDSLSSGSSSLSSSSSSSSSSSASLSNSSVLLRSSSPSKSKLEKKRKVVFHYPSAAALSSSSTFFSPSGRIPAALSNPSGNHASLSSLSSSAASSGVGLASTLARSMEKSGIFGGSSPSAMGSIAAPTNNRSRTRTVQKHPKGMGSSVK